MITSVSQNIVEILVLDTIIVIAVITEILRCFDSNLITRESKMRNCLLCVVLMMVCGIASNGQDVKANEPAKVTTSTVTNPVQNTVPVTVAVQNERWDGFLAGFWFGAPSSIEYANVSGVKLGLPISSGKGKVVGFEWGFCCTTENVKGFQWAMLGPGIATDLSGAQMSLVNVIDKNLVGAQIGIVNIGQASGWQFGIVNHADNAGFQLGIVNFNANGRFPFMVGVNWNK